MKLNFGRRMVLFVHWLLSLVLCVLLVVTLISPGGRETVIRRLDDTTELVYAIAMLVVYLLFAAGSVAIILGGLKKGGNNGFIEVESSENGHTRIAVGAVHQMIRQAVRSVDGIADMKANIINGTDSISIDVDAAILNGTHVPTVTTNIQRAIRSYIELNCGVAVRGVSVSVHSLEDTEKANRRGRRRAAATMRLESPVEREAPVIEPVEEIPIVHEESVVAEEPAVMEEPVVIEPEIAPIVEDAAPKRSFLKGFFNRRKAQESAPVIEPEEEASPVFDAEPEIAEEPAFADESAVEEEPAAEDAPAFEEPAVPEFKIDGFDAPEEDGGTDEETY